MISIIEQHTTGLDTDLWFTREILAHEPMLRGYLRARYPSLGDIDDILQEAYLRVWNCRTKRHIRDGKSFLFYTARNIAIDLIRRRARSPFDDISLREAQEVSDDRRGAPETACWCEERTLLHQAIAALPARARQALELFTIHGLATKEVARQMRIASGTTDSHLSRGIRSCSQFFEGLGYRVPEKTKRPRQLARNAFAGADSRKKEKIFHVGVNGTPKAVTSI